ncbi:ATPase family associated with various cellular activities (AAA) domain-containing protein [Sarocladium implicatum]|nr:ATPase family associated with various cellular activities (AAA) domain-containing protein [Sarocladium implicatum]
MSPATSDQNKQAASMGKDALNRAGSQASDQIDQKTKDQDHGTSKPFNLGTSPPERPQDKDAADAADAADAGKTRVKIQRVDRIWDKEKKKMVFVKRAKEKESTRFHRNVVTIARVLSQDGGFCGAYYAEIRSDKLPGILTEACKKVESLVFQGPVMTFDNSDLEALYHARDNIMLSLVKEQSSRDPDSDLIFELEAILEFIVEFFDSAITSLKRLPADCIDFINTWTLFRPGCLIYSIGELGQERVYQLQSRAERNEGPDGSRWWSFDLRFVEFDGTYHGYRSTRGHIPAFKGITAITALPFVPLAFHPDREAIERRLLQRAPSILRLHGRRIQEYSGIAIQETTEGLSRFNSHGRVMLDPKMLLKLSVNTTMLCHVNQKSIRAKGEDSNWATLGRSYGTLPESLKGVAKPQSVLEEQGMAEEHKMMLNPLLYGFSLGDKTWGQFAVSSLRDVEWDESAIDSLVLDASSKDFIRILMPRIADDESEPRTHMFDDFVKDKGKGLIGLFVGPPGVGKTLTAEVISEVSHRPLYAIGSGELGEDSETVMKALGKTMELAEAWNAVLLLDEADVFMTKRDNANLQRNAITSVFLRRLEYFQGTMLLTTNRLESFDPAFRSRIHFCVHYEDLDEAARHDIWKAFLARVPREMRSRKQLSHEEVTKLAGWELNGRQIKNAMSVAQRRALEEGGQMDFEGIVRAIQFSQKGWGGIEMSR